MMWQTQTTIEYPFALRPASIEEAGLFYSQMDEAEDAVLGTVGHIRMDFGASGKEFYHTWWPHNGDQFNTGEFKDELQKFVDMLRSDGPLTNLASMRNYCYQHGGKITEDGRCFGYIAETEHYRYCLRCTPSPGEYQGYLYSYDLRQQRMAQQAKPVGRITYASGEEQTFTDAQKYLDTIREELPYPADIDDYALKYFGPSRYHSNEFQQEAYLFIPFDEKYYQTMAQVIEERFENWQGQDFDEDTLEPSEVAHAIMEYLDCECTYFPSMADDDPIMSAYSYAQRLGVREGFVPVLIQADDETLLECLVMNADPEHDADCYEFDLKTVEEYRKKMLSAPVKDGKAILEELTGQRKEEAEDDDLDWEEEVLGEMEGGEPNDRFANYWNDDTGMTYPLILAKIPVKNPWEIFAYLPFGNWNECPDTPDLMAVAKYWFEQHGAIPAAMSHDELEFELPTPISKERAMEVAVEQYGFCPDLDQNEDGSIGSLADVLWQSTVWYFWWD